MGDSLFNTATYTLNFTLWVVEVSHSYTQTRSTAVATYLQLYTSQYQLQRLHGKTAPTGSSNAKKEELQPFPEDDSVGTKTKTKF
jgi:hypothetical protein